MAHSANSKQFPAGFEVVMVTPKQLREAGYAVSVTNTAHEATQARHVAPTAAAYRTAEMKKLGARLQDFRKSSASQVSEALNQSTPQPKQPKEAKAPRQAVSPQQWIPTPQIAVTGSLNAPTGVRQYVEQEYIPVPSGEGSQAQYMFSLNQAGDIMSKMNEDRVSADNKVKALERELRLAHKQISCLEQERDDAYAREAELELQFSKLKHATQTVNRRPDISLALRGRHPCSFSLPFSTAFDPQVAFLHMLRIPQLDSVPTYVVWALMRHLQQVVIPPGGSIAAFSKLKKALHIIISGYACRPRTDDESVSNCSAMCAGHTFGESYLMGGQNATETDLQDWQVETPLNCLVLPSKLHTRLMLSECALLNTWSESAVSHMLSATFHPLRPPIRYSLCMDPVHTSVLQFMTKFRALLSLASGEQHTSSSDSQPRAEQEFLTEPLSANPQQAISLPIRRNAPLYLMLLRAQSPCVPTAQVLKRMVLYTADFWQPFVCSLFEIDKDSETVCVRASASPYVQVGASFHLTGVLRQCAELQNTIVMNNCHDSLEFDDAVEAQVFGESLCALLCVPVFCRDIHEPVADNDDGDQPAERSTARTKERFCGVLALALHATDARPPNSNELVFQNREEELLKLMASQISSCISESLMQLQRFILTRTHTPSSATGESDACVGISQATDTNLLWRIRSLYFPDYSALSCIVPTVPPTALANAAESLIEGDKTFEGRVEQDVESRSPWLYARGVVYAGSTVQGKDVISPSARATVGTASGVVSYHSNDDYAHRSGLSTSQRTLVAHWPQSRSDGLLWTDSRTPVKLLQQHSRLVLAVHEEASHKPICYATLPLFHTSSVLNVGRHLLPVFAGPWPAPDEIALSGNTVTSIGCVEIEIGVRTDDIPHSPMIVCADSIQYGRLCWPSCVPKQVRQLLCREGESEMKVECEADFQLQQHKEFNFDRIYPPSAGGGRPLLLQRLAMHCNTMDVWVPPRLTNREQQFLWINRDQFVSRPELIPLLLKSFTQLAVGKQLSPIRCLETLIQQCSVELNWLCTNPPSYVCLQLLQSAFGDPCVRAAAVDWIQSLPPPRLCSLLLPLVLCLVHEPNLDTALCRALLCAAVQHAADIRLHLFWVLRVLMHSQDLKQITQNMLKLLLDSCEEQFSATMGLQVFSLHQICSAAQVVQVQSRDRRTKALQESLRRLHLPFATRLPVFSSSDVVPSIFYRGAHAAATAASCSVDSKSIPQPGTSEDLLGLRALQPGEFPFDAASTAADSVHHPVNEEDDQIIKACYEAHAPLAAYWHHTERALDHDLDMSPVYVAAPSTAELGTQHVPWTSSLPRPNEYYLPNVSVALSRAGIPVRALLAEKCRSMYANARRRVCRSVIVFEAGSDDDLDITEAENANTSADSDPATHQERNSKAAYTGPEHNQPHPVEFLDSEVHVLVTNGPDAFVMQECVHASLINLMARIWRECGHNVGDALPVYAYGVHSLQSRNAEQINAAAAWVSQVNMTSVGTTPTGCVSGTAMDAGESVPACLTGMMVIHPETQALSDLFGVGDDDIAGVAASSSQSSKRGGYGKNTLQRWFMAHLFNRFDSVLEESHSEGVEQGERAGAYQRVVSNFTSSLAAHIVASYVLALGERRPSEILVTPQGYVSFASLAFTDKVPAPALHKDVTMPRREDKVEAFRPAFASRVLTMDLLAVLGHHQKRSTATEHFKEKDKKIGEYLQQAGLDSAQIRLSPSTQQLLLECMAAFMALRHRASDIVTVAASHIPLGCPGLTSSHDVACLRSRLMLHLDDNAAQFQFINMLVEYLQLYA